MLKNKREHKISVARTGLEQKTSDAILQTNIKVVEDNNKVLSGSIDHLKELLSSGNHSAENFHKLTETFLVALKQQPCYLNTSGMVVGPHTSSSNPSPAHTTRRRVESDSGSLDKSASVRDMTPPPTGAGVGGARSAMFLQIASLMCEMDVSIKPQLRDKLIAMSPDQE